MTPLLRLKSFCSSRAVLCSWLVSPAIASGCAGTLGTVKLETRFNTKKTHLVLPVNLCLV